jgi:hypothetical protein
VTDSSAASAKVRRTLFIASLAIAASIVWNFLPLWLLKDSLSEPLRALWIWGVFPLSIPIFYAFLDRFIKQNNRGG